MPKSIFPNIGKRSGKLEKKEKKKDVVQLQNRGNQAAKWVKKTLSNFKETAPDTFCNIHTHIQTRMNTRVGLQRNAASATNNSNTQRANARARVLKTETITFLK